jgi:hypothetical protein
LNCLAYLGLGPGGPEFLLPDGRRVVIQSAMLDTGSQMPIISLAFALAIGLTPQPIPGGPKQLQLANGQHASIGQYFPGLTLVLLRGTDNEVSNTMDWYGAPGLEGMAEIIVPIQAFHSWASGGIDHLTSVLRIRPHFKTRRDPTVVTVPVRFLRGEALVAAAAGVAAAPQQLQQEEQEAGTAGAAPQQLQRGEQEASTAGAAPQQLQQEEQEAGAAGAAPQQRQAGEEEAGAAGAAPQRQQEGQEGGAAGIAPQHQQPSRWWRLLCLVVAMVTAVWHALRAVGAAVRAIPRRWGRPLGAVPVAAPVAGVTGVTGVSAGGDGGPGPPDWGAVYDSAVLEAAGEASAAAGGVWSTPQPRYKRHPGSTVSLRRLQVLLLLLLVGLVIGSPLVAAGRPPRGAMGQEGAGGASFRWPSA